ncbi:MAG: tRNA threonylcarbamoyladenosine biosynthesis protein TsaE [Planctomycetota bacterium]|jgi:tRNA threonylcarbamoyladenosine biosynthesis protein TsaE
MDQSLIQFRSSTPESTEALAELLGGLLFDGVVLALEGEMGAGKTTFARGLARGLGVDEPVTSPTYTLMQEYEGRLHFWHLDAWMAEREEAFLEAGAADLLGSSGVALVEWSENVRDWLPIPRLLLRMTPCPLGKQGLGLGRTLEFSVIGDSDAAESELHSLLRDLWRSSGALEGVELLPGSDPEEPGPGGGEPISS